MIAFIFKLIGLFIIESCVAYKYGIPEYDVPELIKMDILESLTPTATNIIPLLMYNFRDVSSDDTEVLNDEVTFGGNVKASGTVTIVGRSGESCGLCYDPRNYFWLTRSVVPQISYLPTVTVPSTVSISPFVPPVTRPPVIVLPMGHDAIAHPVAENSVLTVPVHGNVHASGKVTIAAKFGGNNDFDTPPQRQCRTPNFTPVVNHQYYPDQNYKSPKYDNKITPKDRCNFNHGKQYCTSENRLYGNNLHNQVSQGYNGVNYNDGSFYGFVPAYGKVIIGGNFNYGRTMFPGYPVMYPNYAGLTYSDVIRHKFDQSNDIMVEEILAKDGIPFEGLVPAHGKVTIAAKF